MLNTNIERYRDLTLIDIGNNKKLVIACDSTGGIGMKENDTFKVEPEIVGFYSAQVVLTELIAYGAEVITVVDALAVEMEGYGERILDGIKKAVKSIGLDPELCINGSTEENIYTTATGIGITAIGIIENKNIVSNEIKSGDVIIIIGKPSVAEEVINEEPKNLMSAKKLQKLVREFDFKEVVPIGSKGALSELKTSSNLRSYSYKIKVKSDSGYIKTTDMSGENSILNKSAGPATSVIAILSVEEYDKLLNMYRDSNFILRVGIVV